MRVLHLNYSDNGGTGLAIRRVLKELNKKIDSKLYVSKKTSNDLHVRTFSDFQFLLGNFFRPKISLFFKLFSFDRKFTSTPAILRSRWLKTINQSNCDIVNLHWINSEMMSIEEIGKINKKICWTFHDMWPFCGGENISFDSRYVDGYVNDSKFKGFDYNAWMWKRKIKNWSNIKNIIAPSTNHKKLILNSKIFKNSNVEVIHNGIDLDLWKKSFLSTNIKQMQKIKILYVFTWGEEIKGLDLFQSILLNLKKNEINNYILILCGIFPKKFIRFLNSNQIEHKLYGMINDEKELIKVYSKADFAIITSRAETLPNIGIESLAMDLPLIAFNETGSVDLIENNYNGFLIKKFDVNEFAMRVKDLILNNNLRTGFSINSSKKKKFFCIKKISEKYIFFYNSL
jgi:glycosyltransferase involved in cell wall biosynthesis